MALKRPNITPENQKRVIEAADEQTVVDAEKLSFDDALGVVLDEYARMKNRKANRYGQR